MPYKSDTIATTIKKLNTQHFLPAIQREFVWNTDKIISLFDSIMRGYPIGSFLFWELAPENKDKWQVYKFVEQGSDGGKHNESASTRGVNDITLVLDGQQRLSSLLIALKGTYIIRKKYAKKYLPTSYVVQRLYLNLLKDSKTSEEDGEVGIYYGFRFAEKSQTIPKMNTGSRSVGYWTLIARMLSINLGKTKKINYQAILLLGRVEYLSVIWSDFTVQFGKTILLTTMPRLTRIMTEH